MALKTFLEKFILSSYFPSGLIVCETREQLNQVASDHPETVLHDEDGGYYLKDMNGARVAVAADSLCPDLNTSFADVDATIAQVIPMGEARMDMENGLESTVACTDHRCFTSGGCTVFPGCRICTSRQRCL
ncbi:hypothetical protein BBP40_008992 [Aspergillus hancockii]|nr:hypothetical protein BBP40_008992 [Aspergillus hancockii]